MMMKTGILLMMLFGMMVWNSCNEITKGYLETGEAEYAKDTLWITLDPDSRDSIPYQSEEIQGVIGTFPIYYELAGVKDAEGQAVDVTVASQIKVVRKAVFQIAKDHTIPAGVYTLDLRVWNLGRSFTLREVYTVVVETAETGADLMTQPDGNSRKKECAGMEVHRIIIE